MMKSHILILTLTVMSLMAAITAEAAQDNKRKKKQKVTMEEYDVTLPQPDAPLTPLMPQNPLPPENVSDIAPQVLHVANQQIGGIDVSHYQGIINWQEVARNHDIHYVYLKATEGASLVDDTYRRNLQGARKAGLRVGAYHFYNPTADFKDQFQNLTSKVKLRELDLIPIIDIEHRGKGSLGQFQFRLQQFLKLVERHYGVQPILYTSRDFYNKYLSGPFTHYKYMIARYHPDVPELCDNAAFVMWQYSSTSRVRGIRGNVDRSCMMDNYSLSDILLKK